MQHELPECFAALFVRPFEIVALFANQRTDKKTKNNKLETGNTHLGHVKQKYFSRTCFAHFFKEFVISSSINSQIAEGHVEKMFFIKESI